MACGKVYFLRSVGMSVDVAVAFCTGLFTTVAFAFNFIFGRVESWGSLGYLGCTRSGYNRWVEPDFWTFMICYKRVWLHSGLRDWAGWKRVLGVVFFAWCCLHGVGCYLWY